MRVRASVLVLVLLLAGLATACGGGGDAGGSNDCRDLSKTGDTFTIHIENFEFDPPCFTASASQAISIVNGDGAVHSFTIEGTQIDVDVPADGTFNGEAVAGVVDPGTYDFVCKYHPEMKGTVTVVA